MAVRLSIFSGSSGLIRRTCAEPVKARLFQANCTSRVECVLGWGSVGGERLYRSRSGQEREQEVELDSC